MLKLSRIRNKGIGVIEIICSIAMFLLLSSFILSVKINNLKLNIINDKNREYIEFLGALKSEMYYNNNYEELKELKRNNLLVINGENMNFSSLKNKDIKNIFTEEEEEFPYLVMNIEDDKEVLKITFQLHTENKVIKSVWFKGAY